jgi:hypothetical protein
VRTMRNRPRKSRWPTPPGRSNTPLPKLTRADLIPEEERTIFDAASRTSLHHSLRAGQIC